MGNPVYQNTTAVGTAVPIVMDWTLVPFNASYAVGLVGSTTGTFNVQYTLDDIHDSGVTAIWFAGTSTSSNATGVFNFPVRATRLETTGLSANGIIRFSVLQGLPV